MISVLIGFASEAAKPQTRLLKFLVWFFTFLLTLCFWNFRFQGLSRCQGFFFNFRKMMKFENKKPLLVYLKLFYFWLLFESANQLNEWMWLRIWKQFEFHLRKQRCQKFWKENPQLLKKFFCFEEQNLFKSNSIFKCIIFAKRKICFVFIVNCAFWAKRAWRCRWLVTWIYRGRRSHCCFSIFFCNSISVQKHSKLLLTCKGYLRSDEELPLRHQLISCLVLYLSTSYWWVYQSHKFVYAAHYTKSFILS